MPAGKLYIVSTPVGNLEDMTYRAVRVLKEVHLIACEDTRESRKLFDHFGIETRAVSYHEHNEAARAAELVERIEFGDSIALISDAGTPLVSDPGYRIVHLAVERGVTVIPIPGASAILAALAASGLPTDAFHFAGFLPAKTTQRRKVLEAHAAVPATVIFYETPHRILEALEDIETILGPRPVVVARELTKLHEEFLRGTAAEIRRTLEARPSIKGEFTLLIGKGVAAPPPDLTLEEHVEELIKSGRPRMDAIKEAAHLRGLSKREAYALLESAK
jgi:16S rRNA (cytidine1402-2'-O)-methyltransferase